MSDSNLQGRRWAVLIAVGCAVALSCAAWQGKDSLAAVLWRWQLAGASDEQAEPILDQLAGLREKGLPAIVEALGSARESVARNARRVLWEKIRDSHELASRSQQLAALAEELSRQVDGFSPVARADASEMAVEILRGPLDGKVVDRSSVTAACDRVLAAARLERQLLTEGLVGDGRSPLGYRRDLPESETGHRPSVEFADERGESALTPGIPSRTDLALSNTLPGSSGSADSLHSGSGLRGPNLGPEIPTAQANAAAGPLAPPVAHPLTAQPSNAANADLRRREMTAADTVELMRRLQAAEPATVDDARAELMRRGFTEIHLELARRLFDPDPEVRKQLARRLPELHSVDAMPWLLRLTQDADSEVRLVALTLLATTGDPTMLSRVQEIARDDPDPGVQRQIEQMAGRHPGATESRLR